MLRALNGGAIHVAINNLDDGLAACRVGGFDCLAMSPGLLADKEAEEVKEALFDAVVAPGAWGVPFNWRASQDDFDAGFSAMKAQIKTMQGVGVTRCATWILPGSNDLTTEANTEFHRQRLTPIAQLLADHGMIFGLEFVGPKTLRDKFTHGFFYSLMPMYEFAQTVGPNVGLLVDAWHMHTSESSLTDLATIPADKISLVHINDAPPNLGLDELVDHKRCLPCSTGVIDLPAFMATLREIGYEGPVEAEPFDETLKELPSDKDRLEKVGAAMAKAFAVAD
ncbi:MAG: TIM barrel protein [Armatimonadetes bacterium]|nr:TIM barrel protein [Armatimonadota bacterium]MBS1726766.1 sugar phosphate isomerase/epimerase [Armatimonadota bacterium]